LTKANLRSAIVECFTALEIVGRRVVADVPLTEASAIADFALNVAVIRGEPIAQWQTHDLAAMPVLAMVDGINVAGGTGAQVLAHPLNALLWLAERLQMPAARPQRRQRRISPLSIPICWRVR
jgi:2-keto-4-pentenoate hydratase